MNQKETLAKLIEQSISFRGTLISRLSVLEGAMNLFLAQTFCDTDTKQTEILETLFATKKITYADKVDTVIFILNKYHKGFLKEHIYLSKTKLIEIGEKRNIIAHCFLNTEEEGLKLFAEKNTVSFLKYHNSKEPQNFSNIDLEKLFNLIEEATKSILSLIY